jgi:hypothetical protein
LTAKTSWAAVRMRALVDPVGSPPFSTDDFTGVGMVSKSLYTCRRAT